MDYRITTDGRRLRRVDLAMNMSDYTRGWHPKYGFPEEQYIANCWNAITMRLLHDPRHQQLISRREGDITWRRDEQEDIETGSTVRRLQASFYVDEAEYLVYLLGQ